MSSDETTTPQVGLNPTATTLLVDSRVSGANGSMDSGGSHSLGMSHVQSGESNARGDNPESRTSKTRKRQERKREKGAMNYLFHKSIAGRSRDGEASLAC